MNKKKIEILEKISKIILDKLNINEEPRELSKILNETFAELSIKRLDSKEVVSYLSETNKELTIVKIKNRYYISLIKKNDDEDFEDVKFFKDVEEQFDFIDKKTKFKKNTPLFFTISIGALILNLTLSYFGLNYLSYLIYIILFFTASFILSHFNYKIIIASISIFSLLKYFSNNYYLSQYYSSNLNFDMTLLFMTSVIIFTFFILELLFSWIHMIALITTLYYRIYLCLTKGKKILAISLIIFIKIIAIIIYYYTSFEISILCFLLYFILLIKLMFKTFIYSDDLMLYFKNSSKTMILFFDILKNINTISSKISQNTDFIAIYSFSKLSEFSKFIVLFLFMLWTFSIVDFKNYIHSESYHRMFFEVNNNSKIFNNKYCTNLGDNDLIIKTNKNNTVLTLDDKIYDNTYNINILNSYNPKIFINKIYKYTKTIVNNLIIPKLYNFTKLFINDDMFVRNFFYNLEIKKSNFFETKKYYINETKCVHKYDLNKT